ncbi:unannotated protein [freshwater metagenome]|uniref:Unannotated protein n=1 Tax=freshwater metagenome TaxID=449393 RepID=A0A6J7HUZ2_9ZZZZ
MRAGAQAHVRHPLNRGVLGGVGVGAPIAAGQAELPGHGAVELVADEHAVADEVPLLGGHPFVVPACGGEAELGCPVAGHVHERRAVLQAPELVGGGERGTRVVRLVAERAVELGRMADRLMDGKPEIRRIEHDGGRAWRDARGGELLGEKVGHGGDLSVPIPAVAAQVLESARDWRGE